MESTAQNADLALLAWQLELGADEAIAEAPVNRYALEPPAPKPKTAANAKPPSPAVQTSVEEGSDAAVAQAEAMASGAASLDDLRSAMADYPHCALQKGARNLVFCDGMPGAKVMLVGEAPGRDEDREGRPFVGRAGQLLDLMFAAIDMGRARSDAPLYITNVLPWRPPQNRDPKPAEIAMMKPFLLRHIALAAPEILIPIGKWSCTALLGRKGITRLRGTWTEAEGKPALPMLHPAYLLRNPAAKREAWADLLSLKHRLREGPSG